VLDHKCQYVSACANAFFSATMCASRSRSRDHLASSCKLELLLLYEVGSAVIKTKSRCLKSSRLGNGIAKVQIGGTTRANQDQISDSLSMH